MFQQEYECDFHVAIIGSYYGRLIARLEADGRVTRVPYDPHHPVYTAWDLGLDDSKAIWFAQIVGREVRIIDYLEVRNRALVDIVTPAQIERLRAIEAFRRTHGEALYNAGHSEHAQRAAEFQAMYEATYPDERVRP